MMKNTQTMPAQIAPPPSLNLYIMGGIAPLSIIINTS